jgi:anti-sigma B factor antagonist
MSLAEEFEVPQHSRFEIRTSGDLRGQVIQPHGELDLATVDQLRAAVMSALDGRAQTIVLDLSRLDFMDSTGIQLIIGMTRNAAERRRKFLLRRGPRQIQKLFDLVGLTDRLPFAD